MAPHPAAPPRAAAVVGQAGDPCRRQLVRCPSGLEPAGVTLHAVHHHQASHRLLGFEQQGVEWGAVGAGELQCAGAWLLDPLLLRRRRGGRYGEQQDNRQR